MKKNVFFTTILVCLVLLNMTSCKKEDKKSNTPCGTNKCTYTLQNGETAGTTPSTIIGKYSLTYTEATAGGPFKNGDKADFELTSDNKLIVTFNNDCITLENPIQSSPSEVMFTDNCKHNALFGASKNSSDKFNEINIISLSKKFYGQFK